MRSVGLSPVEYLFGCLVISMLACVIYGGTLHGQYVFDDLSNVRDNRYVRMEKFDLDQLRDVAFRSQSSTRPVAYVSFALTYYAQEKLGLNGDDVVGFHLVNIAIHVINGLLVGIIALVTYQQLAPTIGRVANDSRWAWMALLAGCVFVAHPLQTQAVTYIVQRMTSLAVMFYLAAFVCYLVGRRHEIARRRWIWWAAGSVCWALALGSKQIAVTLPLAILLYESYFFRNLEATWLRRSAKYLLIALLLVGAVGVVYMATRDFTFSGYRDRDFTMGERVLTQWRVMVFYISLVFWPVPSRLSLIHEFTTSHSLIDPHTTWMSLLVIVGLVALAIWGARRWRLLSFAILWFFLHLALESSVVALEMAYEHRLYLPLVGVAVALPWVLFRAAKERSWGAVLTATIVVLLAASTLLRNQVWRTPETLWSDVIAKNPKCSRAYNARGVYFAMHGDTTRALQDFENAIRYDVDDPDAYNNQGLALAGLGTEAGYRSAIESYGKAIERRSEYAEAFANRAVAYYSLGMNDEALPDLDRAVQLQDSVSRMYLIRASVRGSAGDHQGAILDYTRVLAMDGENAQYYLLRGDARSRFSHYEAAMRDYEAAGALQPQTATSYSKRAWLLAASPQAAVRDGELAVTMAEKACELSERMDFSALAALAAAYAERGDYRAAAEAQDAAMEVAPGTELERMRALLMLYLDEKPYRFKAGEME